MGNVKVATVWIPCYLAMAYRDVLQERQVRLKFSDTPYSIQGTDSAPTSQRLHQKFFPRLHLWPRHQGIQAKSTLRDSNNQWSTIALFDHRITSRGLSLSWLVYLAVSPGSDFLLLDLTQISRPTARERNKNYLQANTFLASFTRNQLYHCITLHEL